MEEKLTGLDPETLGKIRAIVADELKKALGESARVAEVDGSGPGGLLAGDLKYFRLPELLQLVSLQRLTGRLTMLKEGKVVQIYLRGGRVAYATGVRRIRQELLGHMLTKMGRLTKEELDDALIICAKSGKRLGEVLVSEGMVKVEHIRHALTVQTERSVYRAMAWSGGAFYFELCDMPGFVEDIPIAIKVEGLILEGVRQIGEAREISERIPDLRIVFTRPVYSGEEIEVTLLEPGERRVLELIDGKRDVRELVELSGMDEFSLLKSLYALYSAGIIKKIDKAVAGGRTQYL